MNDINLLRPLIEQEEEKAKSRGHLGFYITLVIIILLIVSGTIFGLKFIFSSQAKSLDSQISALERDVSEVKSTEEKINNFNSTISKLKSLDKNKLSWSSIYDNIAKSTPGDVQLSQVGLISTTAAGSSTSSSSSSTTSGSSATATAAGLKLKITGDAKSRRAIALFQYKLQKLGGNFVSVDIISTKKNETQTQGTAGTGQATAQTGATINFELNISLKSI